MEKVIKSTAKTHQVNIQAQLQRHKIKLVSEVAKVKEEYRSVILNAQEEFDEATVNDKGKSRRNVISLKTKGEEKIHRSQRACVGSRSKLKV